MARLTIAWVKEYAKTNGIFLVKTSAGYAVQYQRLIDELTYEDSVGYRAVFKTLKETKDWIDDQNPVDVLGIDKETAKEIYEDAKNFSDKVDRDMGVDREEEVKTPLETYVDDVESRENWILSLTEDELDNSGLSDQEVSFWVKNQNKNEDATLESSEIKEAKNGGSFTYKLLKSFDDDSRRYFEITYQVFNDQNLVLIDDGFNFNLNYSKDAAKLHALTFLSKGYRGLLWFSDEEIKESMPLTFEEVREYAESAGYELLKPNNVDEKFMLIYPGCNEGKMFLTSSLNEIMEVMKDGRFLNNWSEKTKLTLNFKEEFKNYALNAGYNLEIVGNYFKISLLINPNVYGHYAGISHAQDAIRDGRMLNKEFCALPEITEEDDMALTKESNSAVGFLVKYDFTAKNLTQFEEFALASLKKYVEDGIEPKLIKTFAETLIKKLTQAEKISLRDKALGKVFKNKERLKTVLEIFSENDRLKEIMAKDENELSDTEAQIKLKHLRSLNLI